MSVPTPVDGTWAASVGDVPAAGARHAIFKARWSQVEAAAASSRGTRHAVNEDCHSRLDGTAPLFVVADGVGGGAEASRASRELVSRLHATLDDAPRNAASLRAALLDADRAIERSIGRDERSAAATVALCAGSGSTLSRWLVAWVGDCRVYHLVQHDAVARAVTVDDTYRQLQEQPPAGGSPDDPARMVGNGAVDAPNVRGIDLRAGEMLVICSDGVHKHAEAVDIARVLRERAPLAGRCARLIEVARARGSQDDATVLVVHRADRRRGGFARIARIGLLAAMLAAVLGWLAAVKPAAQTHGLPDAHPDTRIRP